MPNRRQCPRCRKWFVWPDEYVEHAWNEKEVDSG
jgi:hypothetical protein